MSVTIPDDVFRSSGLAQDEIKREFAVGLFHKMWVRDKHLGFLTAVIIVSQSTTLKD